MLDMDEAYSAALQYQTMFPIKYNQTIDNQTIDNEWIGILCNIGKRDIK